MRCVSFIHRDDDTGYGISFPDFPGCVSVGDSVDEAIRHWREALAFHVEGLSDEEEPIPPPRSIEAIERHRRGRGKQKAPTKTPITIRLDADIAEHFRATGPGWQTRLNATLREALFGPAK
ncbi:MAG: type II toxin-antitoxin system HicB family antitoxin [Chromatiales bacterium]|nr:type II toxin-antitoxin system HicB family antitoxin [Chromatiales bacterium]